MLLLLLAGSPRFELGITESKSVELPLLHEPLKSIAFHPFYGSILYISEILVVIKSTVSIVVSQPLTAASDLFLQAVVSYLGTSM